MKRTDVILAYSDLPESHIVAVAICKARVTEHKIRITSVLQVVMLEKNYNLTCRLPLTYHRKTYRRIQSGPRGYLDGGWKFSVFIC